MKTMRHVEARAGSPLYKNVTSRLRIIRHGYANVSLSVSRGHILESVVALMRLDACTVYRVPCFQIIFKSLARARVSISHSSLSERTLLAARGYTMQRVIENLASISLYSRMIPRMIRNRDSILARGTKVREIERSKG